MSLDWLAQNLSMRSATNVSQQLRRGEKSEKPLSKPLIQWIKESGLVA